MAPQRGEAARPLGIGRRRWQRRLRTTRAARFDIRPAATPDDIAMITVMLHGEKIGRLVHQVCGAYRKALICKESINQEYQGFGLGRRALLAALATARIYEWTTTPQSEVSARFW